MSSKGVTPVVATALLIGIAVSTALTASVFMEGTLSDVRDSFEDDISERDRESDSEMSIDYGYEQGGYLLVDVRNTGSIALPLRDNETKVLSVYLDGRPSDGWSYLSDREVLGQDATVTINTTEAFPAPSNSTEVDIRGAYETQSSIICYNDGSDTC